LRCVAPTRFLKKKINGVDVQGLIDEWFLSPYLDMKGDPVKSAEAARTGEPGITREG